MRSGGGYFPVSKYVKNDFSSNLLGSIHSAITLFIPRTISSCPLYPIANIQVIWAPFFVRSIESSRSVLISEGTSQRSPTISSRTDFSMSLSTSLGIFSRKSWNIPAISTCERSSIFSFESAHKLTYSIWAPKQSSKTFSMLSHHFSCQKEAIFDIFFAHLRFPSMINPICLSISVYKKVTREYQYRKEKQWKSSEICFFIKAEYNASCRIMFPLPRP